jgi:hypothetical protein
MRDAGPVGDALTGRAVETAGSELLARGLDDQSAPFLGAMATHLPPPWHVRLSMDHHPASFHL